MSTAGQGRLDDGTRQRCIGSVSKGMYHLPGFIGRRADLPPMSGSVITRGPGGAFALMGSARTPARRKGRACA